MSRQYDFTDDLALERINKDEQQKKYRQSRVLRGKNAAALVGKCSLEDGTILVEKNNKESEFCTLDFLFDLKQKNKVAELNAYTEAVAAKTQLDGLTPIFITPTVKSEYNIVKDDIEDMELCLYKLDKQYEMHDNFWHSILTDKLFKDSTKHKHSYGMVSDYYSIPADKRPFIRSSELTQPKSGKHLYNVNCHNLSRQPFDSLSLISKNLH